MCSELTYKLKVIFISGALNDSCMHFERAYFTNKIIDLIPIVFLFLFLPYEHMGGHCEGGHGGDEGEQGEENETHPIQNHCGELPISLSMIKVVTRVK